MSERNVDDFNRGAARVLAHLYRCFPVPALIPVEDLDDGADLVPEERAARLAERRIIYGATVEFLAAEGLLVFTWMDGPVESRRFEGARLTAKGLRALDGPGASLTQEQTA